MKKRLVFLCVLFTLLVILVIMFAFKKDKKEEKFEIENIESEPKKNIQLLRSENGQIEDVDLQYYLLCVVASEIPFKYEYEAIKAQAIVARTYLFNKIENSLEEVGDVCDNYAHCQAFNELDVLEKRWREKGFTEEEIREGTEKIKRAVKETDGKIITYEGKIIDALFHASSPGKTEDAKAIWSNVDVPYLKSVECVEDEDYENRESYLKVSYPTFKYTLIENGYIEDLSLDEFKNIKINEYTQSGRVKNLKVGPYCIKAENLRTLFGIKSTNFSVEITDEDINFNVLGYGHGVGMSQVGANTYAKAGFNSGEIIKHFYTGVEVVDYYEYKREEGNK